MAFKKGVSGNPNGRPAMSAESRALRDLTVDSYREVVKLVLEGNLATLKQIAEDPNTPAIKVGLAVSVLKAIKNGDYTVLERIAERIIGKIPEVINVNSNTNLTAKVAILDKEMLKKALVELESGI